MPLASDYTPSSPHARPRSRWSSCRGQGGQLPAAARVELQDVAPRLGGLGQPSPPLEQEGAGIDRAEVLGVELMGAAPVAKCALHITPGGPHLATVCGQAPVIGGKGEPGVDDL